MHKTNHLPTNSEIRNWTLHHGLCSCNRDYPKFTTQIHIYHCFSYVVLPSSKQNVQWYLKKIKINHLTCQNSSILFSEWYHGCFSGVTGECHNSDWIFFNSSSLLIMKYYEERSPPQIKHYIFVLKTRILGGFLVFLHILTIYENAAFS